MFCGPLTADHLVAKHALKRNYAASGQPCKERRVFQENDNFINEN